MATSGKLWPVTLGGCIILYSLRREVKFWTTYFFLMLELVTLGFYSNLGWGILIFEPLPSFKLIHTDNMFKVTCHAILGLYVMSLLYKFMFHVKWYVSKLILKYLEIFWKLGIWTIAVYHCNADIIVGVYIDLYSLKDECLQFTLYSLG